MVRGGGEQHGEEYREVNPLGQVPTLVIDGTVIKIKWILYSMHNIWTKSLFALSPFKNLLKQIASSPKLWTLVRKDRK